MSRVLKAPEERKSEIMDVAQTLFFSKGYENTSVNKIIEETSIAKGTFYYYFKSKEEILDAIIKRFVMNFTQEVLSVVNDTALSAPEKMEIIISNLSSCTVPEFSTLERLHHIKNVDMHQRMVVEIVIQFVPVLEKVVIQGITEGVYHTEFPFQAVEFLVVQSQIIMDPGVFQWSKDEYMMRARALQNSMELMLGTAKGSLDYIYELYNSMNFNM
jgi:AcrR family transcriptional regulator